MADARATQSPQVQHEGGGRPCPGNATEAHAMDIHGLWGKMEKYCFISFILLQS